MGVWEPGKIEELMPGDKPIPVVLLYSRKADGRYKARAVALGNRQQKDDVGYECYSPTVSHVAIRLALIDAASRGKEMCQFDISNAFVNAPLRGNKPVYARLPQQWGGQLVKLKKALYGLRSAPRHWYDCFTETLQEKLGWQRSAVEPGTFTKRSEGGSLLTLVLYVDDGVVCGPVGEAQRERRRILDAYCGKAIEPEIENGCEVRTLLGMKMKYNPRGRTLSFSQKEYADKVVGKFLNPTWIGSNAPLKGHLANQGDIVPKEEFDYRGCVGALNYLVVMTRPDLAWAASQLSRYLGEPRVSAVKEAVRIVSFVGDTANLGLVYKCGGASMCCATPTADLVGFCDSDFAGCPNTRKSTTGCIVYLFGCPVWWRSSIQPVVTTSSAEAEYVALFTLVKELAHLVQVLSFLRDSVAPGVPVAFCDNGSTVKMAQSSVATKRSRHIDVRWHYVREQLKNGKFDLRWVSTTEQKADCLTKPKPGKVLKKLLEKCGN